MRDGDTPCDRWAGGERGRHEVAHRRLMVADGTGGLGVVSVVGRRIRGAGRAARVLPGDGHLGVRQQVEGDGAIVVVDDDRRQVVEGAT